MNEDTTSPGPSAELCNPHREDGEWIWTADTCRQIAMENSFHPHVACLGVQKNIINRFIDFYLGGKRPKELSVTDLVFAVIAIMPINLDTEHFTFKKRKDTSHYDEKGTLFSLTKEDHEIADREDLDTKDEDSYKEHEFVEKLRANNDEDTVVEGHEEAGARVDDKMDVTKETCDLRSDTESLIDEFGDNVENREVLSGFNLDRDDPVYVNKNYVKSEEKINLDKEERSEMLRQSVLYTPVRNSSLITTCHFHLQNWNDHADARIILKYFFGTVALTLMRAVTKTYKHLVNVFKKKFFRHIYYIKDKFEHLDFHYSVPHRKCVQQCYMAFREKDKNTRVVFAKIVTNMVDHLQGRDGEFYTPFNYDVFKHTVLNYTQFYGWYAVNFYRRLGTKICKQYLDIITEVTTCDLTAISWQRIKDTDTIKFEYPTNERLQFNASFITYRWSRILDENYFKHLSCEENYALLVILAVFIENIFRDNGIWRAKWIENSEQRQMCVDLGRRMYEVYSKKVEALEAELIKEHGGLPEEYGWKTYTGFY